MEKWENCVEAKREPISEIFMFIIFWWQRKVRSERIMNVLWFIQETLIEICAENWIVTALEMLHLIHVFISLLHIMLYRLFKISPENYSSNWLNVMCNDFGFCNDFQQQAIRFPFQGIIDFIYLNTDSTTIHSNCKLKTAYRIPHTNTKRWKANKK